MQRQVKHKIVAGFFTAVFSLNTVVGFACSLGFGFNSKHHDEEVTDSVVHIHKDGKKHIHNEKKNTHSHGNQHKHGQSDNHHDQEKKKDNCCSDEVAQLVQGDKSLPHSLKIIHPTFLIAFVDVFYNDRLPSTDVVKNIKQFLRGYHPPISSIRIAIRSFQI